MYREIIWLHELVSFVCWFTGFLGYSGLWLLFVLYCVAVKDLHGAGSSFVGVQNLVNCG